MLEINISLIILLQKLNICNIALNIKYALKIQI